MPRRLGLRFAVEAAFILAVAAAALVVDRTGAIDLTWPEILAVMFTAWLLMAVVEWAASRRQVTAPSEIEADPEHVEPVVSPTPPEAAVPPVVAGVPLPPVFVEPVAVEEEPEPERVDEEPAPVEEEEAQAAEKAPHAEEDAGAAEDEPEVAPEPPQPIRVPEREPQPAPAEPELEPAAVVETPVVHTAPREWNLWDLERLANERAGEDVARDEERGYLLVYLREFATADGALPIDFDALVRDSFGELIAGARPR